MAEGSGTVGGAVSAARSTICSEAHELLLDREAKYGPMTSAFDEIAELASLLVAPDDSPAERAIIVQLATKLVRRTYTPNNADHYRDAAGYLGVLWEKRAARLALRAERTSLASLIDTAILVPLDPKARS
jgi:hypothetical protein